jgi:transcription antitermination factor NusG
VDKPKWVVVELSSAGEQESETNVPVLENSIRRILRRPDIGIFVPALSTKVRKESQTLVYMDGYVFIEFKPDVSYLKLRDTTYFREVLCTTNRGSSPIYSLVDDSQLNPLRQGIKEIQEVRFAVGDPVVVKSGTYKNMRGIVVGVDGDMIDVKAILKSKALILGYRSTYLEKLKVV